MRFEIFEPQWPDAVGANLSWDGLSWASSPIRNYHEAILAISHLISSVSPPLAWLMRRCMMMSRHEMLSALLALWPVNPTLNHWPFLQRMPRWTVEPRTSQRASNAERWRFHWCQLQQVAKQTVELPMIRDAMTIWRPFYIILMEQPMKHQSSALLGHYNGDNSTVVSYLHSKSVTPQLNFKILAIPNTTTNVNID